MASSSWREKLASATLAAQQAAERATAVAKEGAEAVGNAEHTLKLAEKLAEAKQATAAAASEVKLGERLAEAKQATAAAASEAAAADPPGPGDLQEHGAPGAQGRPGGPPHEVQLAGAADQRDLPVAQQGGRLGDPALPPRAQQHLGRHDELHDVAAAEVVLAGRLAVRARAEAPLVQELSDALVLVAVAAGEEGEQQQGQVAE